jgi:peptide/nickel transport system substrate-binding protein
MMHMKRAVLAGTRLLALAMSLATVSGALAQQSAPKTVTIARAAEAPSLDPHQATAAPSVYVYANIFDTLVEQDRDLSLKPALAEAWEQVSPTTWRFRLRRGVTFHDGTPFNAQAVKFTFDRVLNEKTPARGLSMAGPISGVKVVDDHTVEISTPKPYGPFLHSMSEVFVFGIVSPTAVEKHGAEFGRNPVGTGPFAFDSWQQNSHIVLRRHDNYWGEKPRIDRLVFRMIPEASAQLIALGVGETSGIVAPDANILPRLRADKSVTVYEVPGIRMLYVGFNTKRPVFEDVRVRRAFNHAVNRRAIAEQVLRGTAVPATGYLPSEVFGFADIGVYDFDPNAAKRLLAEAGWTPGPDGKLSKDGKPLSVNFWGYTGRDPSSRLIGEVVQSDLQKIGVTVNLRIWEYSQLNTAIWKEHPKEGPTATEYDMFMLGWGTITGDADFTLYGTLSDISIPPEGLNGTFWSPKPYMDLIEKARFSTDPAERKAAYRTAQEMLHENAIWVPLVVLNQIVVLRNEVESYKIHPVEYYALRMKDVSLKR